MSTLTYKFNVLQADGVTVMSPLPTFTVHAVGLDGASTLTTGGKARGFQTVTFNADGTLPTYTITAPVPGTDPAAPPYTYIIKQGAVVLREGTFTPIETSAGIVNLNILLTSNFAKAVTPQMYSDVATLIANGNAAVNTFTSNGSAAISTFNTNGNAAIARVNGAVATAANTLTAPVIKGTTATRQAANKSSYTQLTFWRETDGSYRLLSFNPGDTVWRDVYGNDPDAAAPPPDTGVY